MAETMAMTVRYASGSIEHRYGTELPNVGDSISLEGEDGLVTSVEQDGEGHWIVWVDAPAPGGPTSTEAA